MTRADSLACYTHFAHAEVPNMEVCSNADSLIDYNHFQTTLSIGIVFKEW